MPRQGYPATESSTRADVTRSFPFGDIVNPAPTENEARARPGSDAAAPHPSLSPLPHLRFRCLAVAFLLASIHAAWLVYGEVVLNVTTSSASLVPSVLALLFLLIALNSAIGRIYPSGRLSRAELVVCYGVITLSAVITGFDFLQLLPHSLLFPAYRGATNPIIARLGSLLPSWFRPTDAAVVRSFYEGKADLFDLTLWRAWSVPLLVWAVFVMLLLTTMLCGNVLVRQQWFRKERLPFPLIELPLTLCDEDARADLFRSSLFWGAFVGTICLLSLNALSMIFPSLPGIQLDLDN